MQLAIFCYGMYDHVGIVTQTKVPHTYSRPRPIMLKSLPIMLLSSAQKIAHYAQYYAHNINDATVQV